MSEPEFYEVKNWERFQYREKAKPGALRWIKFYPDLLSDPAFDKLSDFNKGAWCMLLLIAARNEGRIPNDPDYLKRRLGFFRCPQLAAFEAAGFLLRPISIQSRSNLDPTSIQPRSDLDPTSTQTRSNEIQEHQRVTAENCALTAPREEKRREEKIIPPISPKGDLVEDLQSPLRDELQTAWNALAKTKGYTECRVLTGKRRTALTQRAKEPFWRDNWREGMNRLTEHGSAFLSGHNDRKWTANLEWFLRPDTLAKILEGQYDSKDAYKGDPEWSL